MTAWTDDAATVRERQRQEDGWCVRCGHADVAHHATGWCDFHEGCDCLVYTSQEEWDAALARLTALLETQEQRWQELEHPFDKSEYDAMFARMNRAEAEVARLRKWMASMLDWLERRGGDPEKVRECRVLLGPTKADTTAPAVAQFNDGRCENCGGELREAPYVGGDHDEIAYCVSCGKHYGCWECDKRRVPRG